MSSDVDILIIGAGPAGLMAACWAAQYDMSVRFIDQKPHRTQNGHADGLQSRTLEILDTFGLAEPILQQCVADVESCYWTPDEATENIQRHAREASNDTEKSRFVKILLNQGAIEQVLIDYLQKTGRVQIERLKRAETLNISPNTSYDKQNFPVSVGVSHLDQGSGNSQNALEIINARFLVACDGAHSWVRSQLNVPVEGISKSSTWGVVDIVPITDFPDIRQSCAIQSAHYGSLMTVPRENRLVRFYIQFREEGQEDFRKDPENLPDSLVEIAAKTMKPYKLTYKRCDWWSTYTAGRRLAEKYRPHDRVFLVGDAAHSHSPMGGQGMNISIQDSHNLMWKLGEVATGNTDPCILDTYASERRPVAKELMILDSRLVQAYEEKESDNTQDIADVRSQFSGFQSGTDVTYGDSVLIDKRGGRSHPDFAKNLRTGKRIPSYLITYQRDGTTVHLGQRLASDGMWRLLVLPGDIRQSQRMATLRTFADRFAKSPPLRSLHSQSSLDGCVARIEPILIHSSPRTAVDLLGIPDVFHPFDEELGWDYWKVFADDQPGSKRLGQAYRAWGIDEACPCCLVLCRPDQHIAWVGTMDEFDDLASFPRL